MADYSINQDPSYAHSMDVQFKPTPSPLPEQKKAYDQYNKDYTDFLGSQETVGQLQDRYSNKFNIPFLEQNQQQQSNQLGFLGNQLQALPASVNSATANSMLTQGQKDRMVQSQQAPLANQYNQVQTAANQTNQTLGTARTNMGQMITAEQAQQMKMTQPWLQKYDEMNIQNAAENTQWTQTNQWELNRLLANQSAGVTLSEGQQNRLEQLAAQEDAFHNQLAVMDKQNQMYTDMWG